MESWNVCAMCKTNQEKCQPPFISSWRKPELRAEEHGIPGNSFSFAENCLDREGDVLQVCGARVGGMMGFITPKWGISDTCSALVQRLNHVADG